MTARLRTFIARARTSPLARNTLWMFLGQGLRIIVQAVYFIVIARLLGPAQYGAFVAVIALVAILAPFATLGFGNLLIKNVVRDRTTFAVSWGNALLVAVVSASLLFGVVLLLARIALPPTVPLALIASIAAADLLGFRILDLGGQAFQAFERLGMTATINILPSLARCAAALAMALLVPRASAAQWGVLYCASTMVALAAVLLIVTVTLGRPRLAPRDISPQLKEGSYFSFGLAAQSIYNDIDKTMLARLATLDAAGIYGAAYRIIDVSFLPVRSILYASYPRFFHHGKDGLYASWKFAKRLLPLTGSAGVLIGIVLYLAAPILPRLLGSAYSDSIETLRWLAPLPLLKSVHYFIADTLTGSGHQGIRTIAQIVVAATNVALNLWLIPLYSWRGAAWASIASDGALIAGLWISMLFLGSRRFRGSFGVPLAAEKG